MNEVPQFTTDQLSSLGLARQEAEKNKKPEESATDFLQLFVAQLRNQNPLEPQEGSEFLGQLAQFSTVEGIKNMESSFAQLANTMQSNQALQASSLVGRNVEVKSQFGVLKQGETLSGSFELPRTVPNLSLDVMNKDGNIIRTYEFSSLGQGFHAFNWDGLDSNGSSVEAGPYRFIARGNVDGKQEQFGTYIGANVNSVTIDKDSRNMTLNVEGHGQVSIEDIRAIS